MTLRILLFSCCVLLGPCGLPALWAEEFQPETGFKLLLNGKNLDGWKTKAGDALDGQTEAFGGRFKLTEGELVIDPKIKGDFIINTTEQFAKNLHLKFEFLPDAACNNDLYLRGVKFDLKKQDVKNVQLDRWNQFEIIIQDDMMELKNNGESIKTTKVKPGGTPLGLRAEFGALKVRRLRVLAD